MRHKQPLTRSAGISLPRSPKGMKARLPKVKSQKKLFLTFDF
jgi:hypothetical protein